MGVRGKNTIVPHQEFIPATLKDMGRERANPSASVFDYCSFDKGTCETPEAGDGDACQDSVTVAAASTKNLSGAIFNGFTDPLQEDFGNVNGDLNPLPVSIPLTAANQARINRALDLLVRKREATPTFFKVEIDDVADEAVFTHIGSLEVTELTFSNSANEALTRICNLTLFKTFTLSILPATVNADPNVVNVTTGSSDPLAGAPYTADAAGAAALQGDLNTSLQNVGFVATEIENLSVTFNAATLEFDISVDLPEDANVTIAGEALIGGDDIRQKFTS